MLRLGGDEFAVFIPGMLDKERAEAFFDRLSNPTSPEIESTELSELCKSLAAMVRR